MNPADELKKCGRVWLRGAFQQTEMTDLARLIDVGEKPGMRLPLTTGLSHYIGPESPISSAIKAFGVDTQPVRLVAFNKSETANWSVPWHQDRVVAVADKIDSEGYSNWVSKAGFWHCEAPPSLLNSMVFIRIHIDPSTIENGPMKLALRSHERGCVSADEAKSIADDCEIETCIANAGDILIVHALTLHFSESAQLPTARRALRVDYARRELLTSRLQWAIDAKSPAMPAD